VAAAGPVEFFHDCPNQFIELICLNRSCQTWSNSRQESLPNQFCWTP
jgi:hypothetical protein